jgi:hypothetical protein
MVLYGLCLGVVGEFMGVGGLAVTWVLACAAAVAGTAVGGIEPSLLGTLGLCALLALPIAAGFAYLPLGLIFFAFVKLTFGAGNALLELLHGIAPKKQAEASVLAQAGSSTEGGGDIEKLQAHIKGQDDEIARQDDEIARLRKLLEEQAAHERLVTNTSQPSASLGPNTSRSSVTCDDLGVPPPSASAAASDVTTVGPLPDELDATDSDKADEASQSTSRPSPPHADKTTSRWSCVTQWAAGLAGPTKTAVGWLAPVGGLKMSGSMSMTLQGLQYSETSVATLAGGLACLLGSLVLAPMMVYGAWAAADTQAAGGSAVGTTSALWTTRWVLWGALAGLVLLLVLDVRSQFNPSSTPVLLTKALQRGLYFDLVDNPTENVVISIYALPFVSILSSAIFMSAIGQLTFDHMRVCYANSFAAIIELHIEWSSLLPPLDELLQLLSDPLPSLQEAVDTVANITRYIEFDPSYFAESAATLSVVNVGLGLLKLLATYGRKAFALFDTMRSLLGQGETDEDDGTVQVHECVADVQHARLEAVGGMAIEGIMQAPAKNSITILSLVSMIILVQKLNKLAKMSCLWTLF